MDMEQLRSTSDIVAVIGSRITLTRRGHEYAGRCPFHEDSTPSLYVVPDKGFYHCFGFSASGDVVAFVQRFDGVGFREAVATVQGTESLSTPRTASPKEIDWVSEVPPPSAPRPHTMETAHHGAPVAEWCYRTLDGAVWGYAARYTIGERKAILQWTYGRSQGETFPRWACRHFSKPRPLYGLEGVAHLHQPIMVVEGEKTAEAAKLLFPNAVVISWPGGVAAVKYADWTPIAKREVLVVPDADAPGAVAGTWICEHLAHLGCAVQLVTPESTRPEGWDLADALADGWGEREAEAWLDAHRRPFLAAGVPLEAPPPPPPAPPSPFSEDALAQRFVERYHDHAKYSRTWGYWLLWHGYRWRRDERDVVREAARGILCEAVNSDAGKIMPETTKRKINSLHMVNAVTTMAGFNPQMATAADQWDADPWLLATPKGTVELRTGTLRESRREDYMLQSTSISPEQTGCPVWLQFLDTVMNHDQELITYLQRLAGYTLTGLTVEQHLSFFYGTGGNGKSVFLTTIRAILGDYATVAPMTTFTESKLEHHPTDIASLQCARLVVSQETEEGRKWAESLIKSLTGGDPIKARYMRQDYFEFIPKFKLLFAGNHKPALRSVDEAMRRRMHIVPWTVTIPAEKRDHLLTEKLKTEYPAILQWMIDGCLLWQQQGLTPPSIILQATDDYLQAEDALLVWLEENCTMGREQAAPSKELYQNYVAWCEEAKEFPISHKRLVNNLLTRNCHAMKLGGIRSLTGIGLKVTAPVPTW